MREVLGPQWANYRKSLGCFLPADDFQESGGEDPDCRARKDCQQFPNQHGSHYVGRTGFGFRTSRCPRTWASVDFVHEVDRAYFWSEKGGLAMAYGTDPPAVLLAGIAYYASELQSMEAWESERWIKSLEKGKHGQL